MPDHSKFPQREYAHEETASIYASHGDRYIVSLIVGYEDEDTKGPRDAADNAVELTRDGSQAGTRWFVFDRETKVLHTYEQSEFDNRFPNSETEA